jgi:hypothetical protein
VNLTPGVFCETILSIKKLNLRKEEGQEKERGDPRSCERRVDWGLKDLSKEVQSLMGLTTRQDHF